MPWCILLIAVFTNYNPNTSFGFFFLISIAYMLVDQEVHAAEVLSIPYVRFLLIVD